MKLLKLLLCISVISIKSQIYISQDPNYTIGEVLSESSTSYILLSDGSLLMKDVSLLQKRTVDGVKDTSFGNNGYMNDVRHLTSNNQYMYTASYSQNICTVKRYNMNGVLDPSYGTNGTAILNNISISELYIDNNSNLYIRTNNTNNNTIIKVLQNGQIDNGFLFPTISNYYKKNITITNNYLYYNNGGLQRYNLLNGAIDTGFGNQGSVPISSDKLFTVNNSTDEVVIFQGTFPLDIKKYNFNGTLNTNFGVNGTKTMQKFTATDCSLSTAEFDPNGDIVFFGGRNGYPPNLSPGAYENKKLIMRLKSDGQEDLSFNGGSFFYEQDGGNVLKAQILNVDKYVMVDRFKKTINTFGLTSSQVIRTTTLATSEIQKSKFLIYPNPVKDELNLILSEGEKLKSLEIFDLNGRLMKKELLTNKNIPVNDLKKGMYVVKIKTNIKDYETKIIKD